jgi:tetratricopeptide (TPR) repeat protein
VGAHLTEGLLLGAAALGLIWLVYQAFSFTPAHDAYVRGDATAVARSVSDQPLSTRISLLTSLGHYEQALSLSPEESVVLGRPEELEEPGLLARINAAEAVAELGRFEEALALLDFDPEDSRFLAAGRQTALAWTMSLVGRNEEALGLIETVEAEQIGPDYEAECFLTWALVLLNLGRRADAGEKLAACRTRLARASTERNVLLLEARWHVLSGRMAQAEAALLQAREHPWKHQGATSYLALGDAFHAAGAVETARTCWSLGSERDPEAFAATTCRARLASGPDQGPSLKG